jgi:hypothetical protein
MGDSLSKTIKVSGRRITVHKATFVMSLQRSVLIAEAGKDKPNGEYKNLDTSIVTYVHQLLYPSLVTCSQGNLPTEAQFLTLLDEDVNKWLEAASSLNPDWFALQNQPKTAQEEKEKNA